MPVVPPGDVTGLYYIIVAGLPWKASWQKLKDFTRNQQPDGTSINVDHAQIYSESTNGWVRIRGKEDFLKALAHLNSVPFEERGLLVDGRNEKDWANLRDLACVRPGVQTRPRNASFSSQSSMYPSRTITPSPSTYAGSDYSTELYFPSANHNYTHSLAPMVDSGYIQQPILQTMNPMVPNPSMGYTTPQSPGSIVYTGNMGPTSVYLPPSGGQYTYANNEQTFGTPQMLPALTPVVETITRKIIITSIPHSATLSDLQRLIGNVTQETNHRVEMELYSDGKPRGHAFVTFDTHHSAQLVVDTLNDSFFLGRTLKVRIAKEAELSRVRTMLSTPPHLELSPQQYLPSPTTSSAVERSKSVHPPKESSGERRKREERIREVSRLRKSTNTPMVVDGSNSRKHRKSSGRIH